MNRRAFLARSALVAGAVVASPLAASAAHASSKPTAPGRRRRSAQQAGEVSDFGVPLPADAAPKEYQFVQTSQSSTGLGWSAMDPLESIYSSFPGYSEPQRAARARGQGLAGRCRARPPSGRCRADGMSWTFDLQPGLMWTNGDEVTADDYVASFRYAADPAHAWDFSWYYDGIIRNFGPGGTG